jgi:predicted metal-binding protein
MLTCKYCQRNTVSTIICEHCEKIYCSQCSIDSDNDCPYCADDIELQKKRSLIYFDFLDHEYLE